MSTQAATKSKARAGDQQALTLVDCDVHPNFLKPWNEELATFFSPEWRLKFGVAPIASSDEDAITPTYSGADRSHRSGLAYGLPFNNFYPLPGSPVRDDLLGPDGELPATDPKLTARQLLDARGLDRALLIPQASMGLGALPNPDVAYEITAAINRHQAATWLASDPRWRGLIHVPVQDPPRAADEIRAWADAPGIVGVYVSLSTTLLGSNYFHPIYEAADHHRLPIVTHVTGNAGIFNLGPPVAGGVPTHHLDYRIGINQPFQMHVANLVSTGIFERFPNVKFEFAEVGFTWVADLMWRLDAYWKAARKDTPWIKRPPSEYIMDHVKFTTQPFIEPARHQQIEQVLEMVRADRTLMYSSDFPHWDSDDPTEVLKLIPDHLKRRVMVENAIDLFGDRLLA